VTAGPLIGVAELRDRLDGPDAPTVLDVRWRHGDPHGLAQYLAGHVPGARYVDLDRELCGPPGPQGRRPIPEPDAFTAAMRRHGLCTGRAVVVYDDDGGMSAARAWWLLRYFGVTAVRLLDGGYARWLAGHHPVQRGPVEAAAEGDFVARPGGLPTIGADEAATLAGRRRLLDARPPERYRGEAEIAGAPGGHIPEALSVPAMDLMSADGTLRPPGELRELLTERGVADDGPVGAYCGSGLLACHLILALEVAGRPAALYPGSWSQWTADPSRPVACGATP
jgi:thiosulfate/3-mercaptopyruvate sulfurtransferase